MKKLIIKLRYLNINLSISDSKIIIDAPKGNVSKDILLALKENKEEIINYLQNTKNQKKYISIRNASKKVYYLLSSAQKRLYFLQQMDLDSTVYNMPYVIPIGEGVNKEKIEEVFRQLIILHESFRTSFELQGEEPVQRIHEIVDFKVDEFTIEKSEEQYFRDKFIQAFDLYQAPLLRVAIVNVKGSESLLMIDMHHIISDGVSHTILEQDFHTLYTGKELSSLRLQYKDYSEWQNSKEQQEKLKGKEDYWLNRFDGEILVLNLPIDYVRPVIQSHDGATVSFTLSKEETEIIKLQAEENGLTLYMSVLSVFTILLSKISGQEDIIVGTPVAGRSHIELERIVGMFVNTLAIRNKVQGSSTIKEYLINLKQNTLETFEHQYYQFEDLVEKVSVERDTSRNPIFDVMFNLMNQGDYERDLSSFNNNDLIHTPGISKFDLTLTAADYGDQLMLSFEYCTKLFNAYTIQRYIGFLKQIIDQLAQQPDCSISELEIISKEEKQQLLYEFNDTKADYPKDKTIYQLFDEQAGKTPDNIAVYTRDKSFTYNGLNLATEKLAKILRSNGVSPGSIVSLMLDRSIEMVIGLMGILRAGCCYLPIIPSMPKSRLEYVLEDSESPLILTQTKYKESLATKVKSINLEELESLSCSPENLPEENNPNNLAYIIYTSGTTGKPKGVMIENHSVVNRIKWMQKNYPIVSGDVILQKTSYTFDVSVWELFWWSFEGASVYMLEPEGEKNPQLISKTIEEQKITVMHFVPSMLEAYLNVMELDLQNINLGSMKYVFSSGEALRPNQVHSFYQLFTDKVNTKLVNLYGPTEATVDVSYFDCLRDVDYKSIPIGKPIDNTELYILDKNLLQVQAVGIIGELMISGVGLSRGYLKKEELTQEKFIDHPYKEGEKLYRTGDLVRWLPDGNIEFLGRIDHQVKIRGFRIELGEIENILLRHESIKESVVLAREENEDKYLCAYIVSNEGVNQEEIRTYLTQQLPDYMIPSYFVGLDSLPLTTNGKVNRKSLPLPEIRSGNDYIAPSNETEEKLVEIWSDVLNVAKEELSATANFFTIGGHSLKATILTGKIQRELGVAFPLQNVFLYSTIRSQACEIKKSTKKDFVSILKAKEQDYYLLSSAQKRLYFLQQMDLDSTVYNMPYVIPIGEGVNKEKIEEVFRQLIILHESFRTSFELQGEEPVQRIHEIVDFKVDEFTIEKSEEQYFRDKFIQAFDLYQAPLLRVAIVNVKGSESLLMIDMHHIISDGVSHTILEQDFHTLYTGKELSSLRLQYKDYSEWQNSKEQQEKLKGKEDYWLNRFDGEILVLNLPIDYVRPVIQSHDGATVSFTLSKEETEIIKLQAEENGLTLYMSVLSVFTILLSKISGQEDIIVGTPVAGRSHIELERIVGMFVNTLAIRNKVQGSSTIKEYLINLKQNTLETFEHQYYQFEDLVEKVSVERDTSRNPIFDVMFNLMNQGDYEGDLSSFNNNDLIYTPGISKFDLTLTAADYGDQLMLSFEYCTKLFKSETIERFINYFKRIVSQLTDKLDEKISTIEIITEEEKQQLLYEFNNTICDYPKDKTIQYLFEEQVRRNSDKVALTLDGHFLSYQELNDKANVIANNLRENGICRDDIVIIFLDRSFETVFSMLGILNSGGAYLPIDPDYPKERIDFILNDSHSKTIITTKDLSERIEFDGNIIYVEEISISSKSFSQIESINKPSDLSYIIYTSGTTGKPKGVMIEHRNVVRLFFNDKFQFDFSEKDVWTMFHSHCFDFSVWEMYGALLYGGKLIIVPKIVARDAVEYYNVLRKEKVTVLNQTPSAFYNLAQVVLSQPNKSLENLRYLIFGGEALKPNKLTEWFNTYSEVKLINMFGITETTVHVTYKEIGKYEIDNNISNIGTSIPTLTTYVVDKNLQLVPKGFSGELLIGGEGVSRGYLGREDLTSEKFIKNPYKPEERLYRSGDLVKMLSNGEMEYLGRIDNQVQLRGFRIELGEIESVLQKYEKIKESVVVAKEENRNKYLCAYIVPENNFDQEEIRTYLSASLPDYMIPSYFMELEALPLTSNGKVNLKVLPLPEVKVGEDYVNSTNEIEEKLVEIWSEILKVEKIGIDNNYFSFGGDSITALRLISAVNKRMNVRAKVSDLYVNQTIRLFSECISNSDQVSFELTEIISIKNDLEKNKNRILSGDLIKDKENVEDIYPASDIQVGMIYYSLIDTDVYHDQMVHVVEFPVMDTKLLDRALYLMMEKHSILRTGFYQNGNDLNQVVFKKLDPEIKHYNISDKNTQEQNDLIREYLYNDKNVSFDIKEHLWRFFTFDLGNNVYCICFICHHAIIDGWSDASFNTELNNIYLTLQKDPHFIPDRLQSSYKDFVIDQISAAKNIELTDFWKDELIDYKRFSFDSVDKDARFNNKYEKLPENIHTKIISIAQQLNVSIKNLCFSAFMYTLKMFSYHNDITVGLITNNRPAVDDGDKILGCFLNTVPFRTTIPENVTWKEYISSINEKLNNLKKYDKISLLKIVELTGEISTSQNPITDIIFNYTDFHIYDEFEENELSQTNKGDETEEFQSNMGGVQSNSLFSFDISAIGGNLYCSLSYITSFISEESVNDFFKFFRTILISISKNPEELIDSNKIISNNVLQKLLHVFNDTQRDFPKDKTISDLFEEQAERTPDSMAVVFSDEQISYSELNRRSNQLSYILFSKGIKYNSFVGIMLNRSIEMIIGIIASLKTGAAYCPIDLNNPIERKAYILKDCEAKILLTRSALIGELGYEGEIIDIDRDNEYYSDIIFTRQTIKSSDLAYLIYTSGTTGYPKGVMIKHRGVVNSIIWYAKRYKLTFGEKVLQLSNYSFDASVNQIFGTLITGASLFMIDELSLMDQDTLYSYLDKNCINVINSVPAFIEGLICDRKKLSALRTIISGGEKLNNQLKNKIRLLGYEIHNHYGPTEFTIAILAEKCNELDVTLGKPIANHSIYIIGTNYKLQPVGVSGELCISGEGLALGYLNNQELTSKKFMDHPFKEGARLYRTGDLARWLPDGNIEFLGRIDHQVKIRGFRIELGEIENVLLKHKQVKECIVLAREEDGDKYLCAYIVCKEQLTQEYLRNYLSVHLPDYMVPSYFVDLEELPLTSNGKVNRKSLPSPEVKAADDYVVASNDTEEKLVEIWSELLKIEKEEISVTANFFSIGGHSIKAAILTGKIHKEIGVEFPLREVFLHTTIKSQAQQINQGVKKDFISIPKAKDQDYYRLSSAQKRLYLLQQLDLESTAYNMPNIISLGTNPDKVKIEEVFQKLVERHESFRTSIEVQGEEPVQRIHEQVDFKIKEISIEKDKVDDVKGKFIHSFNLSKAPLLKVAIVEIEGEESLLMIDMHHIISDGVSHRILEREFDSLYSGEELPSLLLQYKDYSEWQNSKEEQEKIKDQEQYWLDQFEGELPVLTMPTDYARPAIQSFEGASVSFALSKEETKGIKSFTKENDLTLYMSLLSVFTILLYKLSGQEDIVVGIPIAGRVHADLENIVGMFVNTLAVRNEINGDENFKEFINKLKQNTLGAYENQDYQFENLVEKVSVERDISRNPIFDVMFDLANQPEITGDLQRLNRDKYVHIPRISKFDLTLSAVNFDQQILLNFEYCTHLFKAETIDKFIIYFYEIINQVLNNTNVLIDNIIIAKEDILLINEKYSETFGDF
jgi:tyrocidine synthetase-3